MTLAETDSDMDDRAEAILRLGIAFLPNPEETKRFCVVGTGDGQVTLGDLLQVVARMIAYGHELAADEGHRAGHLIEARNEVAAALKEMTDVRRSPPQTTHLGARQEARPRPPPSDSSA